LAAPDIFDLPDDAEQSKFAMCPAQAISVTDNRESVFVIQGQHMCLPCWEAQLREQLSSADLISGSLDFVVLRQVVACTQAPR
jgi:hypothetical protein